LESRGNDGYEQYETHGLVVFLSMGIVGVPNQRRLLRASCGVASDCRDGLDRAARATTIGSTAAALRFCKCGATSLAVFLR
jgi:hypothetical protein